MTTKPRLIYDNLWRKGTAMPSDPVADPQHPVSDTQIDTKSMYWKSSDKAITPTYIEMNLGAGAGAIDFVAILGHNIPSGTTVTLEHDDNADFSSPTSIPVTYYATNMHQFFTAFTEQWVRVKLVKAGGFASAPQVATILCGSYFEPDRNFVVPYLQGIEDYSEIELSDSVILFGQEKPRLKTWLLPFRGLDDASKVKALALMDECGIHRAFVIVFDSDNPNTDSHLVRLEELVSPENQHVEYWNWEMAIKEIL